MANMLHCLIYRFTRSRAVWWVVLLFLGLTMMATPPTVDWATDPSLGDVLQKSPMFQVLYMVTAIWAAKFFGEFEKDRLLYSMLNGKEGRGAYTSAAVAMIMLVALTLLTLGLVAVGAWYALSGGTEASFDFGAVFLRYLYGFLVAVAFAMVSVFIGSLASGESAWSLGIAVAALLSSGLLQLFVLWGLAMIDPMVLSVSDAQTMSPIHSWRFVEAILFIVLSAVGFTVRMRRKELG